MIDPAFCEFDAVYAETMFTDANGNMATAITQLGETTQYFWDMDKSPLGQTQTVSLTATSTSIYGATNPAMVLN